MVPKQGSMTLPKHTSMHRHIALKMARNHNMYCVATCHVKAELLDDDYCVDKDGITTCTTNADGKQAIQTYGNVDQCRLAHIHQ
jgi:hypothetical protein